MKPQKRLLRNPWKTLKSAVKFENPWMKVSEHQVLNPKGNPAVYGTVHFKNLAVGILPLDDEGFTWLVGQYRYPGRYYSWEIPEGGGALNVSAVATAKRELREETGLKAKKYKKILEMDLSNSVTDEHAVVFLATGITLGTPDPEDSEVLLVKRIPFEKAYQMVVQGKITDSMSVAGILRVKLMRDAKSI